MITKWFDEDKMQNRFEFYLKKGFLEHEAIKKTIEEKRIGDDIK